MVRVSQFSPIFLCFFACAVQARFSTYLMEECSAEPVATCSFQPIGNNSLSGRAYFRPIWNYGQCMTLITGIVYGMEPGSIQGWHIHERGDISSKDGSSTAGHFTHPYGEPTVHGLPEDDYHDWGDLGNLRANASGVARYQRVDDTIYCTTALLGRGMIIHASRDKGRRFASQNGDAGSRVAQCVIGIASERR